MRSETAGRRGGRLGLAVLGALLLGGRSGSVGAQARFSWPDTAVDTAQYRFVGMCVAAARRVRSLAEVLESHGVNRDTMPGEPGERLRPLPAAVVRTAQRCAARWAPDTAALSRFALLFQLYLAADRDADAAALLKRRLAAVDAKRAEAERTAVIDSVVELYLDAQPVRLAAAESLLRERARQKADRLDRLKVYIELLRAAHGAEDTARVRRVAREVVAIADSLTPSERESKKYNKLRMDVYWAAQRLMGGQGLLDSLRRSTAAYAGLLRALWARASGKRPEAVEMVIGEKAPPITADYWFPAESAQGPHPRPGRVTLLVFVNATMTGTKGQVGCVAATSHEFGVDDTCWPLFSGLKRLAARYPELQVTVVMETHGFFVWAPPLEPKAEAEYLAKWARAHLPGATVAVSTTPFWNLPAPDGRRLDKPDSNRTRYTFGGRWVMDGGWGHDKSWFLLDRDGMVVSAWNGVGFERWEADDERRLGRMIEILLNRREEAAHGAQ